jgi:hypothetical protein
VSTRNILVSVAEHLGGFELDEPVTVIAAACPVGPLAAIQLSGELLPTLAAALLTWADTLDNVTATAWRPTCPDDDLVQLEVRGRLTDNTPVKVYGGLLDGPSLAGLAPGGRQTLSFGLLREWATFAEAVAA